MIVNRLKFETCKVFEIYWMSVGFNKIFIGSVFWVTHIDLIQKAYMIM